MKVGVGIAEAWMDGGTVGAVCCGCVVEDDDGRADISTGRGLLSLLCVRLRPSVQSAS